MFPQRRWRACFSLALEADVVVAFRLQAALNAIGLGRAAVNHYGQISVH